MNRVSLPKTRREPIHGGSNPASMQDTVFDGDTQSMSLNIYGTAVLKYLLLLIFLLDAEIINR
jgi:hypothetical protein